MKTYEPTNQKNARYRLFARYFAVYALAVPLFLWLFRQALSPSLFSLLFPLVAVPFCAFSTLCTPLLLLLTLFKAWADTAFLVGLTVAARSDLLSFFSFNAALFLQMLSLLLFLASCAHAHLFSFEEHSRNLPLLLSAPFWRYTLKIALFLGLLWLLRAAFLRIFPLLPF